jgi:TRAP-type C4-dicarboxylate transport system substrate-binding protein
MKLIGCFAGVVLTTIVAIAGPVAAQDVTLRVESPVPAVQPASLSMQIFKDEVVRLSSGAIDVEVIPDSPRGSVREVINAVRSGEVFATWMSVRNFSRLVPETAVAGIPFIFENHDAARRVIAAGPAGALIAEKFEAKGFTVLAWLDGGAFNIANAKRPLKTLADFKDLRIGVAPNAIRQAALQALGARTVVMDPKDIDAALRQGDVDAVEQEYSVMYAGRYFESQRYIADTAHFLDFYILIANKRAFANLDPIQQRAVREAARITSVRQHTISAEAQTTALARLQDAGMKFDPLPPATRAALRQATAGVVDDVKKWIGADVVNKALAANGPSGAGR